MIKIIAEIGINHNGSIDICKQLIMLAKISGCDYVKIQKRNPDICVPNDQKNLFLKETQILSIISNEITGGIMR